MSVVWTIDKLDCRAFANLPNLALIGGDGLLAQIDTLPAAEREWRKSAFLLSDVPYVTFLTELTGASRTDLCRWAADFAMDHEFRDQFGPLLADLESEDSTHQGDVRFHSLSLYFATRAIRPRLIVETGVAAGKSSAMFLLALRHNGIGRLISVDLPNPEATVLADGSRTSTGARDVGWVVPDYLRSAWELHLGNSLDVIGELGSALQEVDLFLHDSLHTFEHASAEFRLISDRIPDGGVVLCDDLELPCGHAFARYLSDHGLIGVAYRELGGCRIGLLEDGTRR